MPYQHDVFISYKREENWTPWTRDHFKSLLTSYLQQDLGRKPDIFIDENLESRIGSSWVRGLGNHLATSRVAVVLFSRDYFSSDWCVHELDLMLARAAAVGRSDYLEGIIIPVVAHDGELIPDKINQLTRTDIKKYRIAHINRNTQDYHDFSLLIRDLSPAVANAISDAPTFQDAWVGECCSRFRDVFDAANQGTSLAPKNFVLKPFPGLSTPPRLVIP